MDFKSELCFQNLTDNMAAATATNGVTSSSTTTSSSCSTSLSPSTSSSTTTTTPASNSTINHNFHELCRSCGKTNAELYDLFQTTNSPFNTSSTTCYTHLNNSNTNTTTSCSSSIANGCAKSLPLSSLTFDSVAATAKATAKGQSNMDNILQEMQIWQLMIKCNDGLPQRICAKCTAQFYMIHKFRRKCLKVQTQLRALNEEQKFYERQQQQQQEKDAGTTTIPLVTAAVARKTETLVESNDLANDNCAEQQQTTVDNSKSSVSFETQTGNTKAPNTTPTLLDNVETTMPAKKTEAKPRLGCNDKSLKAQQEEHCVAKSSCKSQDEKKPLLRAAVLNLRKSPTLTLQQPPLEQICDNDDEDETQQQQTTNANGKLCCDQEDLLDTHIIFKTFGCENTKSPECQLNEQDKMSLENAQDQADQALEHLTCSGVKQESKELFNLSLCSTKKNNNENLFITKAALKSYTPTTSTAKELETNSNPAMEETNSNDNNNNNKTPQELGDKHLAELENDNTLSSNSTFSSSSTRTSRNISRKSLRRKVFKHKMSKYVNIGKRHHHKYKSSAKMNIKKLTLKKITTRSWQNKHVRTCSAASLRKKHKIYKKISQTQTLADDIQMEDETSSSVSTTSSESTSSTSSVSAATTTKTTPAVTDLVNNNKTSFSSISQGISSNKSSSSSLSSCIMWKTKAAMKANANDMPGFEQPTSNTTTLPYTANDSATTGSASSDKSSKTPDENQSISSSSNNFRQQDDDCSTNTVMSLPRDNQVKDTEDESEQNLNHNLWPEEADQKQITNYQQEAVEANTSQIEVKQIDQTKVLKQQENIKDKEEEEEEEKEEPERAITLKTSAKIGGMKLIIQRKRGARFKCRRKTEDEPSEPSKPKRRRKSTNNQIPPTKYEIESIFSLDLNAAYSRDNQQEDNAIEEKTADLRDLKQRKVPLFNSAEDENKENPISLHHLQDCDSDSNTSIYRDPLLIKNDMLEDDTHLTDFPKPQLSLQSECSKEMFKLYKEKANLESPKKLIVRVPLTSLTQDFKRLHLTMETENQEKSEENETLKQVEEKEEQQPAAEDSNEQEHNEEQTLVTPSVTEQQEEPATTAQISTSQANSSSSQSELLGFSQNSEASSSSTADSSQPSVDMFRYVQPPLCSASSKINEFINDFQNNCIDSSEIDDTCDMVPQLGPRIITQELSDEIRDVEDTLNGILSEMHDKDMYTPRSAETDEFFPHSVYSPLTDSPATPAHSFYAESPCTINSNPMSVSPFIHQNMDYNAMTPQSNHSSMGHSSHMGSSSVSGGSTGPHTTGVFSEHFPTYNECFEESTQSELIGFQGDIPCFENIEISNQADLLGNQAEFNEEEENPSVTDTDQNMQQSANESEGLKTVSEAVDYVDLNDYKENSGQFAEVPVVQEEAVPEITVTNTDLLTQHMPYNPANYQNSIQLQNTTTNPMIPSSPNTHAQYIVTNTNQGPIIIANPQLNQAPEQIDGSFKAHSNNLQFVTLGQAMEAANQAPMKHLIPNNVQEINWPTSVNASQNYAPQPVISTANGTTTYFINANGELYQASIPTPSLNTIIMPNNNNQAGFNKTNMDNNDNYMQTLQQQQQQQNHPNPSSQYIMLVNNLGGTPQYYATTQAMPAQPAAAPQPPQQAVLFHRNSTNYLRNSKAPNNSSNERNPPLAPKPTTHVPISPASEKETNSQPAPSMRQRVNQQLQQQIKQRQLQLLQPRSPNVTQKITLICRFCHKRPKFTNNVDYSNHIINMHPAEKPYNCPHCPMHFSRRFERQQHVAQVHGSRYQCAQCGLSFCAQRTLDFHLQKYHANLGRSQQYLQQQHQQNSTSTSTPATYQLLQQHNQQQRLVRVEDVHVQVTDENKNKRSIDLTLEASTDIQTSPSMPEDEILSDSPTGIPQQRSQARILCSPDCNDDNDDCCATNQNYDQTSSNNNNTQTEQQYTGNESVNNNHHHHQQHQHVTIPSPEQTEPDSTTTLRHFRKRQLSEISPHFAASPSSSSTSYSFNNNKNNNSRNNNDNINHNSPDNVLTGDAGEGRGGSGGEQIMVERTLRGSHNCLLCEESFTNEIALRKHHHLVHGATQTINNTLATSSSSSSSGLVCTICKRGFRMRNALQRHMETHDAEGRPYECTICQVRFPRPSQLTLHKLTVHKFEKPNSCEECGKQFGTETAMKAHAKEHEEAANAATASEALTSTSSTQSSSRIYLETMTTKTTAISTSTIQTNEQNINLSATTSGEDETTNTTTITTNNEDDNAVFNNNLENTIVSALTT